MLNLHRSPGSDNKGRISDPGCSGYWLHPRRKRRHAYHIFRLSRLTQPVSTSCQQRLDQVVENMIGVALTPPRGPQGPEEWASSLCHW